MAISFNNRRSFSESALTALSYRVVGGVFTFISMSNGTLFPATTVVAGDYFAWSVRYQCNKPRGMRFHVGTAWTAVGLTGVWEYRKADGTWASFAGVSDATNGFSTAGTNLDVTWTVPTDWGSNATAINGFSGYLWYRWRITALTSYTVAPVLGGTTPATSEIYDNAVRVEDNHEYDSGTATAGATQTLTNSGKAYTVDILRNRLIYIHTGTGAGQTRVITSNTATVITIFDAWETTPDSTSQYRIMANFEDLYQADVSGGWGVITKAGQHSYAFNCFLDIRAGAFGDILTNVEFQYDYAWYAQAAHTNAYQMQFGWRPPLVYGVDKSLMGCNFLYDKNSSIDERGSGFYTSTSYAFSYGNRYMQRFDHAYLAADGYIRRWFNFSLASTIGDYLEGWRSVQYPKTSPRTEAVAGTVVNGHSGIEAPNASFKKMISYFNAAIAMFVTNATNYNFKDFTFGLASYFQSSTRFVSMISFYAYTGTTTKYVNLSPRFRPYNDAYSTVSTGRSQKQATIRANISDEFGNPVPNAKMVITDSLANNGFKVLNFDAVDDVVTVSSATANQFSGCTAYSVEAWIYTRTTGEGTFGRIIDKEQGTSAGYLFFNNNGSIAFRIWNSAGTNYTSAAAGYFNNSWYHFVGTWDGSNLRMYVNGVSTGSPTATTGVASADTANAMTIGNNAAGTRTYDGFIRRTRVYRNKALDATEVATLYNNGNFTQNQASPVSGCTGEYNFTDGSGTTVTDSSSAANHGTIGGSAAWYDTNNGLTTQTYTVTTGAVAEFLNGQVVTSGGSYSLSSQPTAATKLRFVISKFVDASASSGSNARIEVRGTDADGNAQQEVVWLEEFGNGTYYTDQEFLTVNSSGLVTTGWAGTMTVDRAGLTYPQAVDTEQWSSPNETNLLVGSLNPIKMKISAPGYEPISIQRNLYVDENLDIALKRSVLEVR